MFTSAQNASSHVIDSRKSASKRLAMLGAFLLSLGAAGFCEAENNLTVTYQDLAAATTTLLTPEVSPIQEASTCASERTDVKGAEFLIVPTTTVTPSGASTTTYKPTCSCSGTSMGLRTPPSGFGSTRSAAARVMRPLGTGPRPIPTRMCCLPIAAARGRRQCHRLLAERQTRRSPAGIAIASVSGGTWPGSPSTTVTLPSPTASALVDLQSDLVLDSTLENSWSISLTTAHWRQVAM